MWSEPQLRAQLSDAQSLLRHTSYAKVSVLHLIWNTEEDLQKREAGITNLTKVFAKYGFHNRLERIPTGAQLGFPRSIGSWFLALADGLCKTYGKDDLLIIHYRGRAYQSNKDTGVPWNTVRGEYFWQSGVTTEQHDSWVLDFEIMFSRLDH